MLEVSAKDVSRQVKSDRVSYLQRLILAEAKDGRAPADGGTLSETTVLISGKVFTKQVGSEVEQQNGIASRYLGLPPTVLLSESGDTFLLPFIRSPYVQQREMSNKMNLFEPRWLTLFTKMIRGSGIAPGSKWDDDKWLQGVSGMHSLPLSSIPEVRVSAPCHFAVDVGLYVFLFSVIFFAAIINNRLRRLIVKGNLQRLRMATAK
jgi:hypothetical protein